MLNLLVGLRQKYHATSLEQVVDQVVGMIFRVTPQEEIELLFLQRAYSEHDYYSGDICFPGGYREKEEKCLQTAMRQAQEEIGLKLTHQHYLGALEFTFITKYGKSRVRGDPNKAVMLRMGILMFHIDYGTSLQIKLTEKQIRAFKWVNLKHFLEGDINNFGFHNISHQEALVLFPAFMIGMERRLYGLTLYTITLFIVNVHELVEKNPEIKVKFDEKFYQSLRFHCTNIQVEGTEEDLNLAKRLYLDNRVGFLKPKL